MPNEAKYREGTSVLETKNSTWHTSKKMFKSTKNQVTFPGLGSVYPALIIRLHLLPTHGELPVTAKQPLCLPGQGGEIYPTHST